MIFQISKMERKQLAVSTFSIFRGFGQIWKGRKQLAVSNLEWKNNPPKGVIFRFHVPSRKRLGVIKHTPEPFVRWTRQAFSGSEVKSGSREI